MTLGPHQDGVHIDLGDVAAMPVGELRQPRDRARGGADIRLGLAARAVQDGEHLQRADHRQGFFFADRGGLHGHVLEHLGIDTAHADHHDGAEDRILRNPGDHFRAVAHHGRDQHAVDAGLRRVARGIGQHAGKGFAHGRAVGEVERHAAGLGLVGDVFGGDLQHHRVADGLGRARRFIGVAGDDLPRDIDAGLGQCLLGVEFIAEDRGVDRLGGHFPARRGVGRAQAAQAHQPGQPGGGRVDA